MKKFTKALSVVLAVMMLACTFSALSFSASAAETTNTITVTSNVAEPVSYTYSPDSTQVTVTYSLQSDYLIENIQATAYYDSSVLKLADTVTGKNISPVFSEDGSYVSNIKLDGRIKINASSIELYDFTTSKVMFTAVFDIIGSGDTSVNFDVEILTATTAQSMSELADAEDVMLVFYDNMDKDKFNSVATGEVTTPVSDDVTIYMAAPRVAPGRNVWSNVDLYYGNDTNVLKVARIHMEETDLCATNINSNSLKTVRSGNWHVFKAVLTADQVADLDAARYIGFVNANNHNYKTSSKFDIRMGGSIADYDGMTFMINGATANTEVAAYTGEWQNAELFVPEYKATTVKFACPAYWQGGVYLYYGSSQVITTVDKIEMTPAEGKTYTVDSVGSLKYLKPGNWQVYTVDLTAEQVEMIDNYSVTGFHSGANIYIKTTSARNVVRNNSIADYQNYVFVINGCLDPASEKAAYTGTWKWMK